MPRDNGFRKRVNLSVVDKDAEKSKWHKRYTRREFLREDEDNQLQMLIDLIRIDFLNANDIAKAWRIAESKFWGGLAWKHHEKKEKKG